MAESRFERWSRRKSEARKEVDVTPPEEAQQAPSIEEQELAINESLPEQELLAKYNLPAPEAIQLGTDVTGFMRKEIPEFLRRKALRALWKSNPVLAVLDGLNDYDEDFTDAATATGAIQSLYKVGQGFIDKTKRAVTSTEESAQQQDQAPSSSVRKPVDSRTDVSPETDEPTIQPSVHAHQTESLAEQNEPEPPPRFRPRMRFD